MGSETGSVSPVTLKGRRTRLVVAAAGFALCCWASWFAARVALGRVLAETAPGLYRTRYEGEASRVAGRAVALSPADPEAHHARAVAFALSDDEGGAVGELERAAGLRPRHYLVWLRLGRGRERAGDVAGAVEAYGEAARLAPVYAAPRWQLGNTLLRAGRPEEAFAELRAAAESRPTLFPYTVELAWRAYGEDAGATAAALRPETPRERAVLARFLAKRGRAAEAVEQWRAGGAAAGEEERRALVAELIANRQFGGAYEVWSGKTSANGVGVLLDGGFEEKGTGGGVGFGWQFARGLEGFGASLDVSGPREGARSLLLEFKGQPDASARLASQIVLVEPGKRYRLGFAARTEGLVSGGPPAVFVLDAGGPDARVLARAEPPPRDTGGWKGYELEFAAPDDTGAVVVAVRRVPCAAAPCPVFGRVWLDEFSLRQVD